MGDMRLSASPPPVVARAEVPAQLGEVSCVVSRRFAGFVRRYEGLGLGEGFWRYTAEDALCNRLDRKSVV